MALKGKRTSKSKADEDLLERYKEVRNCFRKKDYLNA